jgi:hypothetical protein
MDFFQNVFGTDPDLSDPEVPDLELNDTAKHAQLSCATGRVPLWLCPAVSECEETLLRVNIGLDVRPGM